MSYTRAARRRREAARRKGRGPPLLGKALGRILQALGDPADLLILAAALAVCAFLDFRDRLTGR